MTIGRALVWLVFIAAVALGAGEDPAPDRPARTVGQYTVLEGDFHVHSFPGDGGLLPWNIADEARRRGLDVIALTNHNSMWSWRLAQWFARSNGGVIVLPGVELTSAGFHIATAAVHAPVSWRQSPAQAVAEVHAQGGIAIAAHPASPRRSKWDDPAIDVLDGFEAASSNDMLAETAAFARRALIRRPTIASIGSSDFHYFAPLGVSRTFLFATERSAAGVLEAIRAGRTVACDGVGDTYGPAELASAVSADCRRLANSNPSDGRTRAVLSTTAAWLALAALVVLGMRE